MLAQCGRCPESRLPPRVTVGDQRASSYLVPEHREALLKVADHSPEAAATLADYYLLCVMDQEAYKHWKEAYDRLCAAGANARPPILPPLEMKADEMLDAMERARKGSAKDARLIADYYLLRWLSSAHAFPWMERAAELGDLEARSTVARLKVELGVCAFEDLAVMEKPGPR